MSLFSGPDGNILVEMVGEGHCQNMLDFVEQAVEFYTDTGQLNKYELGTFVFVAFAVIKSIKEIHRTCMCVVANVFRWCAVLEIDLCRDHIPPNPVLFPGKVSASPSGKYLAFSDTGHHRILVLTEQGVIKVQHVVFFITRLL